MRRTLAAFIGFALASAFTLAQAPIETLPLPATVGFPEGIAYDAAAGVAYTADAQNGTVARMNLQTKAVEIVAAPGVLFPAGTTPAFPAALGMKVDGSGRLWIAGGRTGKLFVLDTKTGQLIASHTVPNPTASLLNDLALVGTTAYITDTRTPTLWRAQANGAQIGALEPWLNFTGTPLVYDASAGVNGIAATPDGRSLIIVHMGKGLLYRVDIAAKTVHPIDTAGADLTGADGLVLDGSNLIVVRQPAVEIATVQLTADMTKGTVVKRFKNPSLAWPATAIKAGDRLIVVNTQFNTRQNNTTTRPFTLAVVPMAQLLP
jgi:sugar lactone lactonase YvrE